jgi:hypothetical protein
MEAPFRKCSFVTYHRFVGEPRLLLHAAGSKLDPVKLDRITIAVILKKGVAGAP